MKKWLVGLAAVLMVGYLNLWPFPQQDAGDLYIVENLLVEMDETEVRLYAGTLSARGRTFTDALSCMEGNAPGQLFLRQTRRVIFCRGAEKLCNPMVLPEQLPMGACVYSAKEPAEELDMETWGAVLEARERRHPETPTLAQLKNSALSGNMLPLPVLEQEESA